MASWHLWLSPVVLARISLVCQEAPMFPSFCLLKCKNVISKLFTRFILWDILTNGTLWSVCCNDHVILSEKFYSCFYEFPVLATKPWLSGSDYFLILVFCWCARSKILWFFPPCPVLKTESRLFSVLPSVNLLKVLGMLSVTNWMPSSFQIYLNVVSFTPFLKESHLVPTFLGYHQLLNWSPEPRSSP